MGLPLGFLRKRSHSELKTVCFMGFPLENRLLYGFSFGKPFALANCKLQTANYKLSIIFFLF
jgi:hypothetical protein